MLCPMPSFIHSRYTVVYQKIDTDPFKVVDSCWISSTEWSDTFRSSFVYGKKQESRKKYHNRAKKFHLPEEV